MFLRLTFFAGSCPSSCSGHGNCLSKGLCECENGFTGIDCATGNSISFACLFDKSIVGEELAHQNLGNFNACYV